MEELNPDSLHQPPDAATLAALAQAKDLEARDVFDVNGLRLGRVTRGFAEEGALVRLDVALSGNAKGIEGATQDVVGVPSDWIGHVEDDGIHLRMAAEELLAREVLDPDQAKVGARELPRKVR